MLNFRYLFYFFLFFVYISNSSSMSIAWKNVPIDSLNQSHLHRPTIIENANGGFDIENTNCRFGNNSPDSGYVDHFQCGTIHYFMYQIAEIKNNVLIISLDDGKGNQQVIEVKKENLKIKIQKKATMLKTINFIGIMSPFIILAVMGIFLIL